MPHEYYDTARQKAYTDGALVGSLRPLEPGNLSGLVGRFPLVVKLPVDVRTLDSQQLTSDFTDHLASHNLLQETETPAVARPIIVLNTPQFNGCVFVQDPRDHRIYCAATPALGHILQSVDGCVPIVITHWHLQNDQNIPMLPRRPPQQPLPPPPTRAATATPAPPIPPPAPLLTEAAPLRPPHLAMGSAVKAPPMTAIVMCNRYAPIPTSLGKPTSL